GGRPHRRRDEPPSRVVGGADDRGLGRRRRTGRVGDRRQRLPPAVARCRLERGGHERLERAGESLAGPLVRAFRLGGHGRSIAAGGRRGGGPARPWGGGLWPPGGPQPARRPSPPDPPVDPTAVRRAYRMERARRRARIEQARERRLARFRFLVIIVLLLALGI